MRSIKSLNIHQVYFGCILLTVLTIPFNFKINNIAIGVLSLVWVYGVLKKEIQLNRIFHNLGNIIFLSIFILHIVGLLYSDHKTEGIKAIETQLPFFAFPFLLFPLRKLEAKNFRTILHTFILGCFVASVVALGGALIQTIERQALYTLNTHTGVNEYHFFYHQLTSHIGLHAVYFSVYIAFSHLVVTRIVLERLSSCSRASKVYFIALLVYFPIILYLSHSLTIIFTWIFCLTLIVLYHSCQHRLFIHKKILLISALIALPFVSFMGFRTIQEKINIDSIGDFNYSDGQHSGSWGTLNIRLAKWSCALEVFEENFWTGTGTGDDKFVLLEKYEQKEFWIGVQNQYDPHNQFLDYGVKLGIFAVILFSIILLWLFRVAIKNRNTEFLAFLFLFLTFSLTESTLASNKGIVFFVFFSLYFVHSSQKLKYINPSLPNA